MKIFYDAAGELNYDSIDKNTKVSDVLEAIDSFLAGNPISCDKCKDSCCKKPWSVGVDNVCVNSLCSRDGIDMAAYVDKHLVKKINPVHEFTQLVFKKNGECAYVDAANRCRIYDMRPVICRLYICCKMSSRYNMLREMIACTYLKALVLEYRLSTRNFSSRTIDKFKRNPAVYSKNYAAPVMKIISYAEEEGWLYADEKQILYEVNK